MHLSPDEVIFWQCGILKLNATIVSTWLIMLILVIGAKLITRNLANDGVKISRWQSLLEVVVILLKQQIFEVGLTQSEKYLSFLGSLFLLIATANLLTIFPVYEPPTGSLSTTTALAICVFIAVPLFGIKEQGLKSFLSTYLEPTVAIQFGR
jgi:F-type H+-transporting ATPase subunit a